LSKPGAAAKLRETEVLLLSGCGLTATEQNKSNIPSALLTRDLLFFALLWLVGVIAIQPFVMPKCIYQFYNQASQHALLVAHCRALIHSTNTSLCLSNRIERESVVELVSFTL